MTTQEFTTTTNNDINVLSSYKRLFTDPNFLGAFGRNPLDERITTIFITLGISAKVKGYRFLREAVKLVKDDPCRIDNLTDNIYAVIAANNGTKISNVERSIGYAILISYNSGKLRRLNDLFGTVVFQENEKPSASEFIALIAEKLHYENL